MSSILLGRLIIASAITVLYNIGVDQYTSYCIKQMSKLRFEFSNQIIHTRPVAELKKSISARTGLVQNLNDRQAWNNWLLQCDDEEQNKVTPFLTPGEYTFMYRSYVDIDEGNSIRKSLLHLPTLLTGFVNTKRGVMVVQPDGKSIAIMDHFRMGLNPIVIKWEGKLTQKKGVSMIVWTGTSLTTGRGKKKKTIVNPPVPEKLRQIPWEIIKVKDDMIALSKGNDGMLVYAME